MKKKIIIVLIVVLLMVGVFFFGRQVGLTAKQKSDYKYKKKSIYAKY